MSNLHKSICERVVPNMVVDETTGCWVWQGQTDAGGYAKAKIRRGGVRRTITVSREMYKETYGKPDLPSSVLVCHTCDNPACCRPSHLFEGSAKDNSADMVSKGRNTNGPSCRVSIHGELYSSIREASENTPFSYSQILCNLGRVEGFDRLDPLIPREGTGRPVRYRGTEYKSINEAARATGVLRKTIHRAIKRDTDLAVYLG